MTKITHDILSRHWPKAPHSLIDGVIAAQDEVFQNFQINTRLRQIHFWTQVSHECRCGLEIEENLNYTHAQRIMTVWPSRFPTYASALPFVGNPRKLADNVYNGRMWNKPGTDDGWNYRGRGLIQITGKEDYEAVGTVAKLDLVNHPELANGFDTALLIAGAYWQWKHINIPADHDSIDQVTYLVNGGHIGLDERRAWYKVWAHEYAMLGS